MEDLKRVILVCASSDSPLSPSFIRPDDYVVGIDRGAAYCLKHDIHMDKVVGDFDTLDENSLSQIKEEDFDIASLPVVKDVTDTAYAVTLFPEAKEIVVFGGIHGYRKEHFLANLSLCIQDARVSLFDHDSFALVVSEGIHQIDSLGMRFFSLFPLEKTRIHLEGFKYQFPDEDIDMPNPLGVSNEFSRPLGQVEIKKGKAIIIVSAYHPIS